jgi:hypothetical protein
LSRRIRSVASTAIVATGARRVFGEGHRCHDPEVCAAPVTLYLLPSWIRGTATSTTATGRLK